MKKTMFITSVIMVVVMAIALTTSSLAWFSASGSQFVTTNSMKVTAKAVGSTGIGISQTAEDGTWVSELDLDTTGNTNLMPLVPFGKASAPDAHSLLVALVGGSEVFYVNLKDFAADLAKTVDDDETTVSAYGAIYALGDAVTPDAITFNPSDLDEIYVDPEAAVLVPTDGVTEYYNALKAAGIISDQTIGTGIAGAEYTAYMVGAKIDNNKNFSDGADHTEGLYRNGYYTNTFYLQNLATGTTATDINIDTTISFLCDRVSRSGAGTDQSPYTYNVEEDVPYSSASRGAEKYALDPTLCVAVIMRKNGRMTDAQYVQYYALSQEKKTLQDAVPGSSDPGYDDAIAAVNAKQAEMDAVKYTPAYSASSSYSVGAYVWYEEDYYMCTTASAAGTWNERSGNFEAVDFDDDDEKAAFDAFIFGEIYGADAYEIVAYAESKGNNVSNYSVSTLKMGKEGKDFEVGKASGSSTYNLSTTGLNVTNSFDMRGEHTYRYIVNDGESDVAHTITVPADVLEVKVVAWYDAATLNNNNSQTGSAIVWDPSTGSADLKFALRFDTHE